MPLLMCPNCQKAMHEMRRNDVQLEMCPSCRGIWMDRGELQKLLQHVEEAATHWEEEREGEWQKNQQKKKKLVHIPILSKAFGKHQAKTATPPPPLNSWKHKQSFNELLHSFDD